MKVCKRCGKEQEDNEFLPRPTKDNLGNSCRMCRNKQRGKSESQRRTMKVQDKKPGRVRTLTMSLDLQKELLRLLPDLKNYLWHLNRTMLLSRYLIEIHDVLQESMVSMLSATRHPPIHELKPWALRILKNTAINLVRVASLMQPLDASHLELTTPSDSYKELEEKMLCTIKLMKPKQREILELRAEGLKYAEIAKVMGYSEGGAKTMLHSAKKALKLRMDNLSE